MSTVSTIISSFSGRPPKRQARSRSEAPTRRIKEDRRPPAIDIGDERDVSTLVCVEISKQILMNSSLNMGVLVETFKTARRDISISDSVILITTAILQHLGNYDGALRVLSQSGTNTKRYEKMNLHEPAIRSMFVTMLFATNPLLVKMVEASAKLVLDRVSALTTADHGKEQLVTAIRTLRKTGVINGSEVGMTVASVSNTRMVPEPLIAQIAHNARDLAITHPNDSVSQIGSPKDTRYRLRDSDLMSYVGRRKSGVEPEFGSVFRSARPPVSIRHKRSTSGLGYKPPSSATVVDPADRIGRSLTTVSHNINSGQARERQYNVMDFLDTESIASEALEAPPDVNTRFYENPISVRASKPLPTETFIPDSVVIENVINGNEALVDPELDNLLSGW